MKTPSNLYKYLSFNENTIETLTLHKAYYSDPINFNDPLDCKPVISIDVDDDVLEKVVCGLIKKRSEKEFSILAKKLKMKKEAIAQRVSLLSETEVKKFLNNVNYYSTDPEVNDILNYKRYRYKETIEQEILSVFRRGILCLSKKFDSPLMWSHYANNHKGLCIEYDMEYSGINKAKKIIYGGSRELKVSLIEKWLNCGVVPEEIENVCLLTKSKEWSYESEWRLFGQVGISGVDAKIKSIIFGLNCKDTTKAIVINTMAKAVSKVKFWEIINDGVGFRLIRKRVDSKEYMNRFENILSQGEITKMLKVTDDDLKD